MSYYSFLQRPFAKAYKKSYSQIGEDIVICSILKTLGIDRPSYLDIGTNDPKKLNNTYLLYRNGSRGVCVEPNPLLCKKIRKERKGDVLINAGIGISAQTKADFFCMDKHVLSTFSRDEAERMKAMGHRVTEVIPVPLIPIGTIIREHFATHPNLVSLDTEGLDYEILKTFDFKSCKPEVFCIETVVYEKSAQGKKILEIRELMLRNGYFAFSDTYVNTIFVNKAAWEKAGYQTF